MSNEKTLEHAAEIRTTLRDLALDDAEAEARLLDRRLSRDVNVSNEQRAQLVADCFCDYAEALDVPRPFNAFCERFPVLAGSY